MAAVIIFLFFFMQPASRMPQEENNKSKSKSIYTKSVTKSVKLNLKSEYKFIFFLLKQIFLILLDFY